VEGGQGPGDLAHGRAGAREPTRRVAEVPDVVAEDADRLRHAGDRRHDSASLRRVYDVGSPPACRPILKVVLGASRRCRFRWPGTGSEVSWDRGLVKQGV